MVVEVTETPGTRSGYAVMKDEESSDLENGLAIKASSPLNWQTERKNGEGGEPGRRGGEIAANLSPSPFCRAVLLSVWRSA